MPPWTRAVCHAWRAILDRLALGAPESVVGTLDWATRWETLRAYADDLGRSWDSCAPQLFELDVRFGDLGPQGLWEQLDADGALDHRLVQLPEVERAMHEPPAGTRAHPRGRHVLELSRDAHASRDFLTYWNCIIDYKNRRVLDLDDPWNTTPAWRAAKTAEELETPLGSRMRRRPSLSLGEEIPF
jgi:proteasome accessory factor A